MVEEPVRGDDEREATAPIFPAADPDFASVIVVVRRSPFDGKCTETVFTEDRGRLATQQLKVKVAADSPFPVVSKWVRRAAVRPDQIPILPLRGAVPCVKGVVHLEHLGTPDIARQDGVEGALQPFGFPLLRHDDTCRLAERMDTGVRPAGANDRNVRLRQAIQSVLEDPLHSSLRRLSLPSGKGLAIVLNDQLEGAA